jgi:adenosylmethionine-8-amino-7-oxononanoate aminotransferase
MDALRRLTVRVSCPNLILSPPLTVTETEVDDILSAIDRGSSAAVL